MKIVNVVVSGKFSNHIDLLSMSNVVYKPERFSGGVLIHEKCTFLLFANGSFVCLGAKSKAAATHSVKSLSRLLKTRVLKRGVKNMVMSHKLEYKINMPKVYEKLKEMGKLAIFEDELFNGITWKEDGGSIRLFHNGSFFITGLCNVGCLRRLCKKVCRLCIEAKR